MFSAKQEFNMIQFCSIQALLSAPNPEDPLAENIAKHWKENEQEAIATGELLTRHCLAL